MGKVLDWFQAMLVTLTDEEDFIEIGAIVLPRLLVARHVAKCLAVAHHAPCVGVA
jgi:hypothetical protein